MYRIWLILQWTELAQAANLENEPTGKIIWQIQSRISTAHRPSIELINQSRQI